MVSSKCVCVCYPWLLPCYQLIILWCVGVHAGHNVSIAFTITGGFQAFWTCVVVALWSFCADKVEVWDWFFVLSEHESTIMRQEIPEVSPLVSRLAGIMQYSMVCGILNEGRSYYRMAFRNSMAVWQTWDVECDQKIGIFPGIVQDFLRIGNQYSSRLNRFMRRGECFCWLGGSAFWFQWLAPWKKCH